MIQAGGLSTLLKRPEGIALAVYLAFTVVALVGYATFGLNPEWLAGRPALASFYAQAFTLFGQGHIVIGALVLGLFLVRHAGPEWLPAFVMVYIVSFLSEFVGTGVGLPFGHYHYTALLGPQWFERVPMLIPLSWFLMVLPAYVIVRRRMPVHYGTAARVMLATFLFVIWDLSLDPAMSYLTSYWVWEQAGPYYGMPLINLGGWLLTALVLMVMMEMFATGWVEQLSDTWCMAYFGITLLMPLGMVLAAGLWLPVLLTVAGLGLCAYFLWEGGVGDEASGEEAVVPEPSLRWGGDSDSAIHKLVEHGTADDIFGHHARSFAFASRWFSADRRQLVACLYAFCRTTDDLVDGANGQPREVLEERLEAWRELAHHAYEGESSGVDWLDEIMAASAEASVPPHLIDDLVKGVRMDIGHVNIRTFTELNAYCYRVASVVGIWKCYLAGVTDRATLERAAAMGRAMQLTNILRDVGEDLDQGRIYLPAELRDRYDIGIDDLVEMRETGQLSPAYRAMIEALIIRADAEYDWAFPALTALPPDFARASAVAAVVYRGIHERIRRNGYDNLRHRAYTGSIEKVYLGIQGLWQLHRCRSNGVIERYQPEAQASSSSWKADLYRRMQLWAVGLFFIPLTVIAAPLYAEACDASWTNHTETMELEELRNRYVTAVDNETVLEETLKELEDRAGDNLYEEAYAAALEVLRARHAFWPSTRLRHLRAGLDVLDELVDACPDDVEVRYLRLLSGYFLPGFLGRGEYVREDFEALARLLPGSQGQFPKELYQEMVGFVLEHGEPSDDQQERLVEAKQMGQSSGEEEG